MKRETTVKFRGLREKGTMTFLECLGASQEDTMEDSREILVRSLESHDVAELVGGMCHGNGSNQSRTQSNDKGGGMGEKYLLLHGGSDQKGLSGVWDRISR